VFSFRRHAAGGKGKSFSEKEEGRAKRKGRNYRGSQKRKQGSAAGKNLASSAKGEGGGAATSEMKRSQKSKERKMDPSFGNAGELKGRHRVESGEEKSSIWKWEREYRISSSACFEDLFDRCHLKKKGKRRQENSHPSAVNGTGVSFFGRKIRRGSGMRGNSTPNARGRGKPLYSQWVRTGSRRERKRSRSGFLRRGPGISRRGRGKGRMLQ